MRRPSQAGFTIIEIMIVVAIISVIASIAIPAMRINTVRVKMSEALLAFSTCRNAVQEIYQNDGEPPVDGVWGCEVTTNASKYVDSVRVDSVGVIKVSLRGFGDLRIDTFDLTLAPLDATGKLPSGDGSPIRSWRCGSMIDGTGVPLQFLPTGCKG